MSAVFQVPMHACSGTAVWVVVIARNAGHGRAPLEGVAAAGRDWQQSQLFTKHVCA